MAIYSVCRFYEGWSWQFHPKAFSNLHHPPLGLFDLFKTTCCPIFWNLGFQSFFVFPNLYFIKKKVMAITIKDKRFVWSSIHKILNNRKEQELLKDNGGVDDDSVSASIEWAAWGTTCILPSCILPTCILPAKPLFTITLLSHMYISVLTYRLNFSCTFFWSLLQWYQLSNECLTFQNTVFFQPKFLPPNTEYNSSQRNTIVLHMFAMNESREQVLSTRDAIVVHKYVLSARAPGPVPPDRIHGHWVNIAGYTQTANTCSVTCIQIQSATCIQIVVRLVY